MWKGYKSARGKIRGKNWQLVLIKNFLRIGINVIKIVNIETQRKKKIGT